MAELAHPYRLIVFDVDGTLVDSQAGIVASMTEAFEKVGLPAPPAAATRHVVGLSLDEAVGRLLPDGVEDHRLEAAVERYKQAFNVRRRAPDYEEPLFPGVLDMLATLDRPQVCLGVATGKSRRGLLATLDRHGLSGRFVTLQTADDGPGKPHPRMMLAAMDDVGARPEETVLIGDTVYDMEMAVSAGTAAFGVSWGYHAPDALLGAGARAVLSHFDDLPAALAVPEGTPA